MGGVPSLYVSSLTGFSGKTALCLGLALRFRKEGYRVGYFKPIGLEMTRVGDKVVDEDALLMKTVLNINLPLEAVAHVTLPKLFLEDFMAQEPVTSLGSVKAAYREASRDRDFMIIESARKPSHGAAIDLPVPALARELGSKTLIVSRFDEDTAVDEVLSCEEWFRKKGAPCVGAVFNNVPISSLERVRTIAASFLEKRGVKVLGVIPYNIALTAPSAAEVYESLGGEVLACERNMGKLIEAFMVGAMTPESALSYFRRALNKAVVTGGDRSDIALAALETSTSMLILTGNLYPNITVLARAEERGVPVLLVPYDTYTTVEKLAHITGRIKPDDVKEIDLALKTVEDYVDWQRILKAVIER